MPYLSLFYVKVVKRNLNKRCHLKGVKMEQGPCMKAEEEAREQKLRRHTHNAPESHVTERNCKSPSFLQTSPKNEGIC